MPRGGARPGAGRKKRSESASATATSVSTLNHSRSGKKLGRPPGTKNPETLDKIAARELTRRLVMKHLEPLIQAQVANAKGLHYLVVREKSTGKFMRVAENAAAKLNPDEEVIEIWEKDPSVQAFTDLMNRALDKPKEQEQEIKVTGEIELVAAKLQEARKRLASRA